MKFHMWWKVVLGLVLVVLVSATMVSIGCAAPAPEAPEKIWRLSFAHMRPVDGLENALITRAGDAIAERTNNRVQLTVYPAMQLGDTWETTDGVMEGSIDMCVGMFLSDLEPRFAITYLDYLFLSIEDAREGQYPGGWMYEILEEMANETMGVTVLTPWWVGMDGVLNAKKPIRTPADLEGLKIRSWATELQTRVWINYGADVVAMNFGEVYTSFQLGAIDGSMHGPHTTLMYFKDVINYYTHLHNMFESNPIIMNLEKYNSLPSEFQTIVREEIEKAGRIFNDGVVEREEEDMRTLEEEYGVEVIRNDDLTAAEKTAWVEKARSYWPELSDMFGEEILNLILEKATPIE